MSRSTLLALVLVACAPRAAAPIAPVASAPVPAPASPCAPVTGVDARSECQAALRSGASAETLLRWARRLREWVGGGSSSAKAAPIVETYDALEPFVAPWKPGVEAAPLYAHLAYEYGWALLHIVGPKWYDEQPDGQSAERALLARRAMLSAALKPEHPSSLAGLYVLRDPVVRATTTQPWPDVVALVCAKASAAEDPGRAALQEACRVDLAAPPPDPASAPKKKVTERQLRAASEAVEGGTPFAVAFASLVARLGAPHATQGSDLVWATMGAPYCSELRVTKRGDKIGRPLYISYDRAVMPDGFDACVKSAY